MAISVELKQARRDHILDTARKLIGRRDVSGFSMAELAEHAGVSPATPYNLVGSKPEILNALIRFEVKDFASSLEARQIPANLDGLFAAIDLVCERYSGQLNFYRGLFRLPIKLAKLLRKTLKRRPRRVVIHHDAVAE